MSQPDCQRSLDAAGWVLGSLSPREAEDFEKHLTTCADCRLLVARLRESTELLKRAAADVSPPAEIREQLMATVHEEARLFDAAEAPDQRPAPAVRRRRARRVPLVLAAVLLLAAGAVAGVMLDSDEPGGERASVERFTGSVTDVGGGPQARAVVVARNGVAELVLTDVSAPPEGRVYQAWVVRRPSVPTPTGSLFSVPRSGDTRVSLPSLKGVERVIVSAEPRRGSQQPTPPPVAEVLVGN